MLGGGEVIEPTWTVKFEAVVIYRVPVFILGLLGGELSPLKSQTHPLKL